MKTLTEKISKDFVAKLKKEKIKQVDIYKNFDISEGHVSKVFNGYKSFTLDAIVEISDYYRIPIADLWAKHAYKKIDKKMLELLDEAEKNAFELYDVLDSQTNKKAV